MRLTRLLTLALLAVPLLALATPSARADTAVTAILVLASPTPGESDPRLEPYEATLRRILRFERFQHAGQGRATVPASGAATLPLGRNQFLQLVAEPGQPLSVTWRQGNRTLMRTGLLLRPGVPAVLGGPPTGEADEVFAVILTAR